MLASLGIRVEETMRPNVAGGWGGNRRLPPWCELAWTWARIAPEFNKATCSAGRLQIDWRDILNSNRIAFIGAGNMANSLIRGLLAKGVPAGNIAACDVDTSKLVELQTECRISTGSMAEVAVDADVLLLAVKPQVMGQVCETLRPLLQTGTLVISIAAGIPLKSMEQWLGNTQSALAEAILSAVGISRWLDSEHDINAVTALSGSGPAYFFLLMEAMQEAGVALGLEPELARALTIQTALGAAKLAATSDVGPDELRRRVTSPNGTTQAALEQFESEDFRGLVERALSAAQKRSVELAG